MSRRLWKCRAVEAVVYDGADPKAQLDAAQAAVEKVIKK